MLTASRWLATTGIFIAIAQLAVSAKSIRPQCRSLEHAFTGLLPGFALLWPSDIGYKEETSDYWSLSNREAQPQLIIRPESALQASKAIKVLTRCEIQFATKSRGHLASPNTNTSPKVLLVTTKLNHAVVYNKCSKTARFGPAARWGDVYGELLKHGRSAVGGRHAEVGVGGLLLGGAISHASQAHGWAAANVISYKVVLSNGEVVDVSAKKYPDLFWALKGGSNRFAFVIEFTVKTHRSTKIYGGQTIYSDSDSRQLIDATHTWQQTQDPKSAAVPFWRRGPGLINGEVMTGAIFYYNGPVESPRAFEPFYSIPTLNSTAQITTHLGLVQTGTLLNLRCQIYTGSLKSDPGIMDDLRKLFWAEVAKTDIMVDPTADIVLHYHPINDVMQKSGRHLPMALDTSNGPDFYYEMLIGYTNQQLAAQAKALVRRVSRKITKVAEERGLHIPSLYMNGADSEQKVFQSYGEKNLAKLRTISVKYDPAGTFRRLVGGFEF